MIGYLWQLLLVVKHEIRMVLRSWPFRIASVILVGAAFMQTLGMLSLIYFVSADDFLGPVFEASNASWMWLQNATQLLSLMVLFFANDIGSRDRRVGISDVVGARPLSTSQYVIGRMLALVLPLFALMALVQVVFIAINMRLGFHTAPFRFYGPFFLYYFVLIVGLSTALAAFFSTLLRNRLLTSLASLTPLLLSMFWLVQYSDALDMWANGVLGNYSDLIGFGPIRELVLHRLTYLSLALFLVSATVLLYPRIEVAGRGATVLVCVTLLLVTAGLGTYYWYSEEQEDAQRQQWREAMAATTANRAAAVDHFDIEVEIAPGGGRLHATVKTLLRNRDDAGQSTFIFMLNPGLQIEGVTTAGGAPVALARRGPVAELTLDAPLPPGGTLQLVWDYAGKIDPYAAWLTPPVVTNFDEGMSQQLNKMMGELSGWIGRRFCFLLPESQWYPIPNATFGYAYPDRRPANFATARIRLELPAGWTGVTQGALVDEQLSEAGTTLVFDAETPVPQFSLCAGEYVKVSAKVRGIDCAFYYAPVHRENVDLFAEATEDLKRVIGESLEHIADKLKLDYPYPSLSVVEVPVECRKYGDGWDRRNLMVQPGVLLLSESDFFKVYFARSVARAEEATEEEGTGATSAQVRVTLLKRYFDRNRLGGDLELNLIQNYWGFQVDPAETAYPAMGSAFTAALAEAALGRHQERMEVETSATVEVEGNTQTMGMVMRFGADRANPEELLMPIAAMTPSEQVNRFTTLMNAKTNGFVRTLAMVVGEETWRTFVAEVLDAHRFKQITLENLRQEARDRLPEDVSWVFEQFVSQPVVPGYAITHAEAYEIDTGQRERQFQAVVRVANLEEGKGYAALVVEMEREEETDTVEKRLFFDSFQEQEIRMVLGEKPKSIRLVPAYSRNVKEPYETLYVPEERRAVPGEDSVRILPAEERVLAVVVDDLDTGFSTVNLEVDSRLRLSNSKEQGERTKYPPYRGFGAPRRWQHQETERAYGNYEQTRKIKGRGDGSQVAVWSAQLPKDGTYEVFFYAGSERRGWYNITVENGESSQEVELELRTAKEGWNSLGKYKFKKDVEARVKLSDDVREARRGVRVYADAVRWVWEDAAKVAKVVP